MIECSHFAVVLLHICILQCSPCLELGIRVHLPTTLSYYIHFSHANDTAAAMVSIFYSFGMNETGM